MKGNFRTQAARTDERPRRSFSISLKACHSSEELPGNRVVVGGRTNDRRPIIGEQTRRTDFDDVRTQLDRALASDYRKRPSSQRITAIAYGPEGCQPDKHVRSQFRPASSSCLQP